MEQYINKETTERLIKSITDLFQHLETPVPSFSFFGENNSINVVDDFIRSCKNVGKKYDFDGLIQNYFASYLEKDLTINELIAAIDHVLKPMTGRKPLRRSKSLKHWIN